jgi:hypothetical protein
MVIIAMGCKSIPLTINRGFLQNDLRFPSMTDGSSISLPIRTIGRLGPGYRGVDAVNRKAWIVFENLSPAVAGSQISENRFGRYARASNNGRAAHH